MIKNCVISALFASVFFLFFSPDIRAGEPVEIMAGEILVKFKEGTSDEQIKLFVQKYKLTEFGSDPTIQVHFYHSSVDDVTQKVSEITQEKIVKYAQANYVKKRTVSQMTFISLSNGIFRTSECLRHGMSLPVLK